MFAKPAMKIFEAPKSDKKTGQENEYTVDHLQQTDTAWHTLSADEIAKELHADVARGLAGTDAAERLARHGPNVLAEAKQRSALTILVHQFRSLIVGLLGAAGGIALALGDVIEAA